MHIRSKRIAKFGVSILAIAPWLVAAPAAEAACEIKDSPCYPWRIEAGARDGSTISDGAMSGISA